MSRRVDRSLGVNRGLVDGIRKPGHRSFNPDHGRNRRSFTVGQAARLAAWVIGLAFAWSIARPVVVQFLQAVLA